MSKWLDSAVFYQIYPQTFCDTNADGIGDIQGIINKLDYIKELGCTDIWINPLFQSPFQDAGYDISDYYTVAPRYGTNSDLRRLIEAVHQRGMHIIFDLVPGHTSVEHPWFKESMKGIPNRYTKRYIWTDHHKQTFELKKADGSPGSNIRSFILGIGERDGLCATNYYSCQPCLNYGFENITDSFQSSTESPEAVDTREAMMDVMRFWLKMGCDGFRVDMAGALVKNDPEGSGNIRLWRHFREFLDKEFPDAVMISEWGHPNMSLLAGFHMDFLLHNGPSHYNDLFRVETPYFSRCGKGDISEFVTVYARNYSLTSGKGLICIPSGNHDMPRLAGRLDDEEMKIAFAFLLSMPGAPFIYNGDEIGMRQISGLISHEGSRSLRAGCRTPMQWSNELNDGFSDAAPEKLYLPLDPDPNRPRVSEQMTQDNSLWQEVHKLLQLRHNTPELQANAPVEFLYAEKEAYPFVYQRTGKNRNVLIVLNPSGEDVVWKGNIPVLGECIYSLNGQAIVHEEGLKVPAASASFFICKR